MPKIKQTDNVFVRFLRQTNTHCKRGNIKAFSILPIQKGLKNFMLNIFRFSNQNSNERAVLLRKMVWGILAVLSITFVAGIFAHFNYFERYLVSLSGVWILSIVTLLLIKNGHLKIGTFLYVGLLTLIIMILSLTGGGIRTHMVRFLPVVVLFTGLTFGRKQIWTVGIVTIVATLLLVVAELANLLPRTHELSNHPFVYWFCSTQTIILICFIEHLSVTRFNRALNDLKAENILRIEHEEKYKRIFYSFQDIYFQTDIDGKVLMITPSVKKRLGYEPQEIAGKPLSMLYYQPKIRETLKALLIEKKMLTDYELDLVTKCGNVLNVAISCHLIYNEKLEVTGLEGTFFDITHLKRAELKLKQQNEQLKEIANLQSHMVRRPVANVIGLINLLDQVQLDNPENKEVIKRLISSSQELDQTIQHIVRKTNDISAQ